MADRADITSNRTAISQQRLSLLPLTYSIQDIGIQYTDVAASASFLTPCVTAFTCLIRFTMPLQFSEANSNGRFFAFDGAGGDRNFELFGNKSNDTFSCRITDGGGAQDVSASAITKNKWQTAGMLYEVGIGTGRLAAIFDDTIYNETTPTIDLVMSSKDLNIFAFDNGASPIEGQWAEFLLIDEAMSAQEVADFHWNGAIPSTASKLIHFRPSEGTGATIADLSGNGNTGNLRVGVANRWLQDTPSADRTAIASNRTSV